MRIDKSISEVYHNYLNNVAVMCGTSGILCTRTLSKYAYLAPYILEVAAGVVIVDAGIMLLGQVNKLKIMH